MEYCPKFAFTENQLMSIMESQVQSVVRRYLQLSVIAQPELSPEEGSATKTVHIEAMMDWIPATV